MLSAGRALLLVLHAALALICAPPALAVDIDAFDATGIGVLEDPSTHATLADIRQRPPSQWRTEPSASPNLGYSASAYWFRIELRNPGPSEAERLLEIAAPALDRVDLHVEDGQGRTTSLQMGDALRFEQRPLPHRHFVAPLKWRAHETLRLLVRVQSTSPVQFPVRLWTDDGFLKHQQREILVQGLYFGVMLAMLVYNAFLFLSVRETAYLWYVLCVLGAAGFNVALGGFGFQYLWPNQPAWNPISMVATLGGSIGFSCLFAYQFLDMRRSSPRLAVALLATGLPALLWVLLSPFVPYGTLIRLAIANAAIGVVLGFVVGISRTRDGFQPARYYLLAWSMLLVGTAVLAFNKIGFLPRNDFTENAAQIGSAIEVVLLSFALAARLSQERRLREQAQAQAMQLQREANELLEQRVVDRTRALEEANLQLRELSNTDGLTGLHNRRHFDESLAHEAHRAARSNTSFGLLLIDIDHFKRINDTYGHLGGDDCLKHVAAVVRANVRRTTDLVARYGGEEFCAILPAITTEGAQHLAEQIRRRIENTAIAWGAQQIRLTASIGVCCGTPSSVQEAMVMLQQADAALYESKRHGRNRVTLLPVPARAASGLPH
jgi:two-component system, sensor histidine kinase LadS